VKYRELVQFDPIEEVIELRDADKADRAKALVRTYVVSDAMERRLVDLFAPLLGFSCLEAKGIFVVGNYGTGKSHLMAIVSALAENSALLDELGNAAVREAFRPVAGRYLVARFEIGAVTTPLRTIVIRELEKHLKAWGVEYAFPAADQITNHKDAIEAMLAAVEAKHPGKGVLIVIDELLDYLKALGEGAISAFGFLREIGEASGNGRFRVIAGVQESLISSPSFGFLSQLIQKVSARFAEVWITRQDLAFVVESRLLAKTPEQRERIRQHLEKFMPLFPTMSAQKDDFIRLFPVHPRYLQIFEEIDIAEKREVLRTLSQEMNRLLDQDVPTDDPGLIAYDSYWRVIKKTPTLLASPTVGEVEERSAVVASKIQTSFPKAGYRPAAARIIDALSVYRLAVGGIRTPIGLSSTDLRDDLALMLPVPEKDPDFLNTTIESVLRDVVLTVGGQFVSKNEAGQYYLDLDKAIDYDAQVDKKVSSLDPVPEIYDRYYFDILTRVLDTTATTHVPGMLIWPYEVEWPGHRVTRPGYLFFGSPNERSTAQPPRSFYIYFLAHFAPTPFEDARRDDEVFFRLVRPSPDVSQWLKRYAAATELMNVSSGDEKAQYLAIANRHRKAIAAWVAENLIHAFDITHAGVTRSVGEAVAQPLKVLGTSSPRDLINALSSTALVGSFEMRFPGYPSFSNLKGVVTEASRTQTATEGLRYVSGSIKTEQGGAVLDGLGLREGVNVNPAKSPYAELVRTLMASKPEGHVVNRNELIATKDGVESEPTTGLEPEWLSVVLLALAYRGEIEISAGAQTIDATNLPTGATLGAEALARFKTIQRPKAMPIASLKALFEMLELNPNLLDFDSDGAAASLQTAVLAEVNGALRATGRIASAQLGGAPLWPQPQELIAQIVDYKDFLERLTSLNTGGKLRQYKTSSDALAAQAAARSALRDVAARLVRLEELEGLDDYLRDAAATLSPDDPWQARSSEARQSAALAVMGTAAAVTAVKRTMLDAKASFVTRYLELHNAARLDHHGDDAKRQVMASTTMRRLGLLESVQILPSSLQTLKADLASLVTCRGADAIELDTATVCRACHFKPAFDPTASDARNRLAAVENALERLNEESSAFLERSLEDPTAVRGLDLLDRDRAAAVRKATDPSTVPDPSVVQDLNRVLQGLQKVAIDGETLLAALRSGGPATEGDLEQRFRSIVQESMKAKDPATVRLVIE
jgi:hypothetical protein